MGCGKSGPGQRVIRESAGKATITIINFVLPKILHHNLFIQIFEMLLTKLKNDFGKNVSPKLLLLVKNSFGTQCS